MEDNKILQDSIGLEYRNDLTKRLNRIEGQVKGILRMVETKNYCCADILTQVAAVRAAINKVGGIVLEGHSKSCIEKAFKTENPDAAMHELIDTVQRFLRFVD